MLASEQVIVIWKVQAVMEVHSEIHVYSTSGAAEEVHISLETHSEVHGGAYVHMIF